MGIRLRLASQKVERAYSRAVLPQPRDNEEINHLAIHHLTGGLAPLQHDDSTQS